MIKYSVYYNRTILFNKYYAFIQMQNTLFPFLIKFIIKFSWIIKQQNLLFLSRFHRYEKFISSKHLSNIR